MITACRVSLLVLMPVVWMMTMMMMVVVVWWWSWGIAQAKAHVTCHRSCGSNCT